jgi:site-specific recombinase XerD
MINIIADLVLEKMKPYLQADQYQQLENCLSSSFVGFEMVPYKTDSGDGTELLKKFLDSKRVEGCSARTIDFYQCRLSKMLLAINKHPKIITTDDLRKFLSDYQDDKKPSNVTLDNDRRIFSSFFRWLEDEDIIVKSPARRIHKIKCEQEIKEPISDEALVSIKDSCGSIRDLSLIEMLASSGVRVGELVKLNAKDINFNERSCLVIGKGNKQREVYFDAREKIHLEEYLASRKDNDEALFVSANFPHKRLTIGGIEYIVRKIGKKAKAGRIHPHKFRRTMATFAIDKGMPIEQVQKLLGHVRIDTTLHYAMVSQNNVKLSHRRFIG